MKALAFDGSGHKECDTKAVMSKANGLARAQGYQVDTPDGRLGSVAAVLPRAGGKPGYLLVSTGLMACQLTSISFAAVADVDPLRRGVALRQPPVTVPDARQHGERDPIRVRA